MGEPIDTNELVVNIKNGKTEDALNALRKIFEYKHGALKAEIKNEQKFVGLVEDIYNGKVEEEQKENIQGSVSRLAVEALVKLGVDDDEAERLAENVASVKEAKERYKTSIMNK